MAIDEFEIALAALFSVGRTAIATFVMVTIAVAIASAPALAAAAGDRDWRELWWLVFGPHFNEDVCSLSSGVEFLL